MKTKSSALRLRRVIAVVILAVAFSVYLYYNPSAYQDVNLRQVDSADVALKDTQTSTDSRLAIEVLESLAVKEKDRSSPYYRKMFYDTWSLTADGCNLREAILKRDLQDVVLKGCKVQSGLLHDPYTGKDIHFVRGQNTSEAVQIDHVVALSNAWATGAFALDQETRYQISQDPLNLIAVDGPANQDKLDQDASKWLPPNQSFRCEYVARQISVKYKYHLWVTPAEKATMLEVLSVCPDETTRGLDNL